MSPLHSWCSAAAVGCLVLLAGCCSISPMPTGAGTLVNSSDKYTDVGHVEAGRKYSLKAVGAWADWLVCTDAQGFTSKGPMKLWERQRRHPNARWFALIGVVARARESLRPDERVLSEPIDLSKAITEGFWIAPETGTLLVFANDVPGFYWNNRGSIRVAVGLADDGSGGDLSGLHSNHFHCEMKLALGARMNRVSVDGVAQLLGDQD